jgi:hypothetical protein
MKTPAAALKPITLAFVSLGLCSGLALADDKSDAQKKVDQAKTDTCEKSKKFLAEQSAKGKCKAENDEAQKVTCSAATFKQVSDLQTKCLTAKPATKPEPADEGGTECRALDADGKTVIAKADDKSSVKCGTLLMDAVRAAKCTTADMKGKKVEYTVNGDHMIGKTKIKDRKTSLTCTTPKPAPTPAPAK